MAAIGKIREKSGLLVAIVGIALAGFVLNDLFGSLGKGGSSTDRFTTAYINDEQIRTEYFQDRLDKTIKLMEDQRQEVNSQMRFSLMNETWNAIEKETIIRQQCEEIGMAQENGNDPFPGISMKEYVDLLKGENRHPIIVQSFPQPEYLEQFFINVEQAKNSGDPKAIEDALAQERQWNNIEQYIKTEQLKNKYNTLIEKSYFFPTALAKAQFDLQNTPFSVKYFAIRYNNNIEEEEVKPTKKDFEAYYDEHKNEFELTEENRKIEYVVWNVFPSDKDMEEINNKVTELYEDFKKQPADQLNYFVNRNRGMKSHPFDSLWRKPSELPKAIDSAALTVEANHVFPPFQEDDAFKIIRVMDHDTRPDSMRISHILLAWKGSIPNNDSIIRTKEESKLLADSLLSELKKNSDLYTSVAKQFSDDKESANKPDAGDLEWFSDNSNFFNQFKEAVINNNVGDIVLVETPVGYHIVKVTGKTKFHEKVRVAEVSVDIRFSKETKDRVYMEANRFAASNKDSASFYAAVEEQGLSTQSMSLNIMTPEITGIQDSRNIVKWAFGIGGMKQEDIEKHTVSEVFDYPNQIVVAIVTDIQEKGIAPLEAIMNDPKVVKLVQRDVKARQIMEEVGNNIDFNALAKDKGIQIDSNTFMNFNQINLGQYGPEPYVVGAMTNAEVGKTYGPVKGEQGVFFFVVTKKETTLESPDNYASVKNREQITFTNRLSENYRGQNNDVYKALKKEIEIEDFRFNYW